MLVLSVGQNTEYYKIINNTIQNEQTDCKITQDLESIAATLGKGGIYSGIVLFITHMVYLVMSVMGNNEIGSFYSWDILLQFI